jgi:hypothetical protein
MTDFIVTTGDLVAFVQCALIWWGIQRMDRAGQRREKREDQRHREAMTALTAIIERTGQR